MLFMLRSLLLPLLFGFVLAVNGAEPSAGEASAAQKAEAQEPPRASQADKGREDSKTDSEEGFIPFTPSEEILTDRPAAFPADI